MKTNVEVAIKQLLIALQDDFGLDIENENFHDTPRRVAKAYSEIFGGLVNTEDQVKKILSSVFPCKVDQMVAIRGIRAFSLCPHHLLPVDLTIDVAYVPNKVVLGISKISRLVEILSRRAILQEQLGEDVTNSLMQVEGCQGAGCVTRAQHYCAMMRGVRQPGTIAVMSSLKGVLLTETSARAEFLSLTRGRLDE